MTLAFPWWGESGRARPRYAVTLDQLLFAAACIQLRFEHRQEAIRRWEAAQR